MSFNQILFRPLAVLICIFAGCNGNGTSEDDGSRQSNAVKPLHFTGCAENAADQVLLLSITVPGVLNGFQLRIPFCEAIKGDTGYGGGDKFLNADGPDGGLNGLIGIESSTRDTLSVRVDLRWSSSRGKGAFNELINIPVAMPGKKELPGARKVEWRFEAPQSN